MNIVNNRLVIYLLSADSIYEYSFIKESDNKYHHDMFRFNPWLSMTSIEFVMDDYDSSKLNFSYIIGHKLKPNNFLEWFFSNKNIYEKNKGRIFKLFKKHSDTIDFVVSKSYTYDEIINNFIKSYTHIYMGVFNNDYTNDYYNKNIKFIEMMKDEL